MQDKPTLILKRLIIINYLSEIVYDESFHHGVNIIRGENSSGKSTIANFIFYVLGGYYQNWTTQAQKCHQVLAEVTLNGAVVTLKRDVGQSGLIPLSIYYGRFEDSKTDALNWKTFPYKQTEGSLSFSNVLFTALGLPETRSEDSNINMHQILRLLYIDQDTPTQNLFRIENFDLPLTRQTISEVLLGIYEDDLYSMRIDRKHVDKELENKNREYTHLTKIFSTRNNSTTDITVLREDIERAKLELISIDGSITELKSKAKVNITVKSQTELEKVQIELSKEKASLAQVSQKIDQYEVEIFDSEQFVGTIEKRLVELSHSLLTRKVLGELPLTHCPQCLSKLLPLEDVHQCILCKQPLSEEVERANAKRLSQELEIQTKESHRLLENKRKVLAELRGQKPLHLERVRTLQQQLNKLVDLNQSTRDERIDNLLVEKGNAQNRLEYLNEQIKVVEYLDLLHEQIKELTTRLAVLKLQISKIENSQKLKLEQAMRKIKENTIHILKNDLERQQEFRNPQNIEIDFLKDTFSLNESNNFSASSKTYFKNAVLFAIFFASLELDYFRYPRFILCDNMEDKGMEKVRTQNFQEVISAMSQKFKNVEHQIIFTTSMISDNLNNTDLCVGKEYNRNEKSLLNPKN